MGDLSRTQLLAYLVAGALVVVLGALWVRGGGGTQGADAARPTGTETAMSGGSGGAVALDEGGGTIVVHIAGAVRRPGVYRLRGGTRVAGAIRRAGGATGRANLDGLNLAAKLTDGRQVIVPARPSAAPAGESPVTAGPDVAGAGLPVNLNSATLEQLDALDGIGPTTAQKILDYREQHGGFGSVDELDAVPGIGPATVESLRDHVTA